MAHAVVEWTDNLEGEFDLKGFLALIAEEMRERSDGVFPVGGIRVRGIRLTDYVIADGTCADDAFINIEVLMGAGRSEEFKQQFFDGMFEQLNAFLGDLYDRRPFAMTLYVFEAKGWKKNSIHKRLKV